MRRLFLVSVLMLFLELVVIRWVSAEASIFAYVQNILLVICFLSIGLGCLRPRENPYTAQAAFAFGLLILALSTPLGQQILGAISSLLGAVGDFVPWNEILFGSRQEYFISFCLGIALSAVVMLVVANVFVPIGQHFSYLMDRVEHPIKAYSVNILGSLIGGLLFTLCGRLLLPPPVWIAIVSVLFLLLVGLNDSNKTRLACIYCGLLVVLSSLSFLFDKSVITLWTPYQKISLVAAPASEKAYAYNVLVNNYPFLGVARPTDEVLWDDQRLLYDLPFLFTPGAERVLIAGSGSGNDIAGALRHGAKHVSAVEIDPGVLTIGRKFHPAHPYDDPRVEAINDDARVFFSRTKDQYDLVVIALLDSHVTQSLTNTRLDHYVYTKESFERVRKLLAPDGIFIVSFYARRPYIADRINSSLAQVFGEPPLAYRVPMGELSSGGTIFISGNIARAKKALAENPNLATHIENWKAKYELTLPGTTPIITDDWPYLYLADHSIPRLAVAFSVLTIVVGFFLTRQLRISFSRGGLNWSKWLFFCFMGAAFLLFEVRNVSFACAVFGSTYEVNTIVICSLLIMILLANVLVIRKPNLPLAPFFVLLLVSVLVLFTVRPSAFWEFPFGEQVGWFSLTALPVLFSGVIFAREFSLSSSRSAALSANLCGALLGGIMQSLSYMWGGRSLLLIVAMFYALAWACSSRQKSRTASRPLS